MQLLNVATVCDVVVLLLRQPLETPDCAYGVVMTPAGTELYVVGKLIVEITPLFAEILTLSEMKKVAIFGMTSAAPLL